MEKILDSELTDPITPLQLKHMRDVLDVGSSIDITCVVVAKSMFASSITRHVMSLVDRFREKESALMIIFEASPRAPEAQATKTAPHTQVTTAAAGVTGFLEAEQAETV